MASESVQELPKPLTELRDKSYKEIERLYDVIAEELYDDLSLQEELFKRLSAARTVLQELERNRRPGDAIQAADFDIKSIGAKVSGLLRSRRDDQRLRYFAPTLIVFYIFAIALLVIFYKDGYFPDNRIPVLEIPVAVFAWASVGSVASMLYRVYKEELGGLRKEFWWVFSRPIIGVVMGSLAYLAIVSGTLVVSNISSTGSGTDVVRSEIIWIAAFLGGFSDRFFENTVSILVQRLSSDQNNDSGEDAKS